MHSFSVSLTEPELIDALVVELMRGYSFEETLEQAYKIDAKRLGISQMLIVRPPVAASIDPLSVEKLISGQLRKLPRELQFFSCKPQHLAEAFARFPGRPVHLLFSHDHTHYLSKNLNPTSEINPFDKGGVILDRAIRRIQSTELEVIVEAGRARFPTITGVLYEAPSGRLVPSFLRIGNIQRSRAAVDALFFWLLPHLRGCSGIITDTWSIGSIALNASRRLSSYHARVRRPCPVEMVSSYLDGSEESAAEAAEHIERLLRLTTRGRVETRADQKVVFLMSAISTGELHTRTSKLLEQRGTDSKRVHFVSLFNLGTHPGSVPCLVDWSKDAGNGAFAAVEPSAVQGQIDTIKIDPQTYFPTSYKDVLHVIRERDVQNAREFLTRYSDISAIRVHRTVTDDGAIRHHALSIDTVALCRHPCFQQRLTEKLEGLDPPPKLIVTPVHEAGKVLAATAIRVLREKEPHIEHVMHVDLVLSDSRVAENSRILDLINGIEDQSSILILDDAFISGRRLIHYQMALRHVKFRGRFHYLVGVARPTAISAWEHRRTMLKARPPGSPYAAEGNTVSAVEAFALPDWSERECPWCNELQIYQRFSSRGGPLRLSAALRERRQMLEQYMHEGISDHLFFTSPGVNALSFTRDSKFAALGTPEASVFASVASGVQTLRSPESEKRLGKPALGARHYPVVTVMDHSEYLFGTYSDSLLRACLLRAARDYELIYSDQSSENEKAQRAIELVTSGSPIENDVAAEIVLATLANKFPGLNFSSEPLTEALYRLGLSDVFGGLLERHQT